MDPVLIVIAALLLLGLLGLVRFGWRIWRGNEEMQPGGSLGRQLGKRD